MNNKVIVALDISDFEELQKFLTLVSGELEWVKVGLELFYSLGEKAIKEIKNHKLNIFLDLKIHDIPNTASRATRALAMQGVDMINLHASGGYEMMKTCRQQIDDLMAHKKIPHRPKLMAVTQLTSTSQQILNNEILIQQNINDVVLSYAQMAKEAGLDGIICSANEVPFIKKELGSAFECVTPGIRLNNNVIDDQKRIMTPAKAVKNGSDYLVIGRPITQADDPLQALKLIKDEMKNA